MRNKFLSYLKNILYREPSFILRYYLHRDKKGKESYKSAMFFMADGRMEHGGLFDRLKGAVSIYAVSKIMNKEFGIHFAAPFQLEKYLAPHSYDWSKDDNIIYSYPSSRPIIAYSETENPRRLFKKRICQTHFYYGYDIIDYINQKYTCSYDWVTLFNELFAPTAYLKDYVNQVKCEIGSEYYAIHLRFQNLLGDKVELRKHPLLDEEKKNSLIAICTNKIREIASDNPLDWTPVIFSDSMIFIEEIKKKIPEVFIVPGSIQHIDSGKHTTEDENLKLFADVYLIAGAQKVYSIAGKGLYESAFPLYSAKIGNLPFDRVLL